MTRTATTEFIKALDAAWAAAWAGDVEAARAYAEAALSWLPAKAKAKAKPRTTEDERLSAYTVACSTCGAAPHLDCVRAGTVSTQPHATRIADGTPSRGT